MGVVPMLDALQGEFGVPGVVEFVPGRNGMPTVRLRHPSGAGAEAYLHGAHVTSWTTPAGEELLFVSRQSHFAAGRPIRGGIPVIFPQFGPGALPQHGFARISEWHVRRAGQTDAGVSVTLGLAQTPETLALWPYHFDLELQILLRENALALTARVVNHDPRPFDFAQVLHTYFRVADIEQAAVLGLQGTTYIDSLRDDARETETRAEIRFAGEVDRIYLNVPDCLRLRDEGNGRTLTLQKQGMPDVTLWNPWVDKAQRMADFGDDEYREMICVETGVAMATPLSLAPGQQWQGETIFQVENAPA
jgi:glucose-6-phosphate 1-epimerase